VRHDGSDVSILGWPLKRPVGVQQAVQEHPVRDRRRPLLGAGVLGDRLGPLADGVLTAKTGTNKHTHTHLAPRHTDDALCEHFLRFLLCKVNAETLPPAPPLFTLFFWRRGKKKKKKKKKKKT
jgi:hypothetical protein